MLSTVGSSHCLGVYIQLVLGFLCVMDAGMEFTKFTRKYSLKILRSLPCSVEDCSLAVGDIVGHSSIKSYRMNVGVGIFVNSVDEANKVVEL